MSVGINAIEAILVVELKTSMGFFVLFFFKVTKAANKCKVNFIIC